MRKLVAFGAAVLIASSASAQTSLNGTWVTDLGPLGHGGYSHSTFNPDGTYELDMEFIVAGSDCFLDVTTTGTYVADATTVTITNESGTQAVSRCSDDANNHVERAMTEEEIGNYNVTEEFMWSVDGDVLTLTDGADLSRTYARLETVAALHGTWVTDLGPLGHEGYSHSTFNPDGTYELDMEFIVAGSDCFLDVTTTGTYAVNATTIAITHSAGTQAVMECSEDANNHAERAMTEEEIDGYNVTEELMWSIDGDVLTLTDGADLTRTYTRLSDG